LDDGSLWFGRGGRAVFQGAAVEGVELLAASAFFLFDRLQ